MEAKIKKIFQLLFCVCFTTILYSNENRIVTLGGSVTEIVFALGFGEQVIAVDQSSTIPESVSELPQVGYIRSISSEGILSVMPNLILSSSDLGPPNILSQLKKVNIPTKVFESPASYEDVITLIGEISESLGAKNKGDEIIEKLNNDLKNIKQIILQTKEPPRITFFMDASNSGSFNAAGNGTRANYLIELIGAKNIYKNEFNRYNKISSESLLKANPDVILIGGMTNKSILKSSILENKYFKELNAVKNDQVILINLGSFLIPFA